MARISSIGMEHLTISFEWRENPCPPECADELDEGREVENAPHAYIFHGQQARSRARFLGHLKIFHWMKPSEMHLSCHLEARWGGAAISCPPPQQTMNIF